MTEQQPSDDDFADEDDARSAASLRDLIDEDAADPATPEDVTVDLAEWEPPDDR